MKKNRNKYLLKNTLILTIGNFASKIITFFLIPLYTSVLTTSEYGVIDLVTTLCMFLIPFFSLNISESIMRFGLDKNNKTSDLSKISNFSFVFSALVSLIIIPIFSFFKDYSQYSIIIYLYFIFSLGSQLYLSLLKGQEKLKLYTFGNVLHTFLIAVFNIIFLIFMKMGINGYFYAYILSNVCVAIYGFLVSSSFKYGIGKLNFVLLKKMIKYSAVLIPTSFMWWIMNSSDRIMVSNMIGSNENGIYAISYKIPTLISTITGIFTQAWMFSAIAEKDSADNKEYTNKVYKYLFIIITLLAIFLLLICKPFMKIYVSSDFYVAWKYMSYLIVGVVFQTLGTFISTSYNVYKDNKGFLYSGLCGAITNIFLNFLLIPFLKVHGAALATCISYFVVFIYRVFDTRKYVKIDVFKNKYLFSYLLLLLAAFTLYLNGIICQILIICELILFCGIYFSDLRDAIAYILKKF